jgi:hypothetical protein
LESCVQNDQITQLPVSKGIPLLYFGPVSYYRALAAQKQTLWCLGELFPKQTFRNRCALYGANGKLPLSIPVHKPFGHKTRLHEVLISEQENWRAIHWKSIESAYRRSPYFDYYGGQIQQLIFQQEQVLWKYNLEITKTMCKLLDIDLCEHAHDIKINTCDESFVWLANPKAENEPSESRTPYIQVFSDKFGFLPDLSILDLLFNEGPQAQLHIHR